LERALHATRVEALGGVEYEASYSQELLLEDELDDALSAVEQQQIVAEVGLPLHVPIRSITIFCCCANIMCTSFCELL
jgi:hypothetical protein